MLGQCFFAVKTFACSVCFSQDKADIHLIAVSKSILFLLGVIVAVLIAIAIPFIKLLQQKPPKL